MNLLKDDVYNLFVNAHVRIKRYQEFYHSYIYITNEGRHLRIFIIIINNNLIMELLELDINLYLITIELPLKSLC